MGLVSYEITSSHCIPHLKVHLVLAEANENDYVLRQSLINRFCWTKPNLEDSSIEKTLTEKDTG